MPQRAHEQLDAPGHERVGEVQHAQAIRRDLVVARVVAHGAAGDEVPAILQKGEKIIPRGGGEGGGGNVSVPINITIDATGAYPESVAELHAKMAKLTEALPGRVLAVVRDSRDRRLA